MADVPILELLPELETIEGELLTIGALTLVTVAPGISINPAAVDVVLADGDASCRVYASGASIRVPVSADEVIDLLTAETPVSLGHEG